MGNCKCGNSSSGNRYRWQDIIGIPTCITDCGTLEDFILSVAGGGGDQDLQSVTENGNTTDKGIFITGSNLTSFPNEGGLLFYDPSTNALSIGVLQPGPVFGSMFTLSDQTITMSVTGSTTSFNMINTPNFFNLKTTVETINDPTNYRAIFQLDVNPLASSSSQNRIQGSLFEGDTIKSYGIGASNSGSSISVGYGELLGQGVAELVITSLETRLQLRSVNEAPDILWLVNPVNESPYFRYLTLDEEIGLRFIDGQGVNEVIANVFYKDGRISGSPAVNGDEFVTKNQVNSGVSSLTGMTINAPSGVDATVNGSASYIGSIAYVTITITIATTSSGTMDDTEIIIDNIPLNIDTSAGYQGQGGIYYWGPEERQVSPNQKNSISGKFTFYDISGTTRATLNYTEGTNNMNLLSWGDLDYTFTDGFPYEITLNGVLYLDV